MSPAASDTRDSPSTVFISHSMVNSRLADTLTRLLHGVLPELIVYSSGTQEITAAGSKFLEWMREKARTSSHVFILLTPESLRLPWLTFEAGVATAGESRIVPIVFELDPSDVPGPLAEFQIARGDSFEHMVRLVHELVEAQRGRDKIRDKIDGARLEGLVSEYIEQVHKASRTSARPNRAPHDRSRRREPRLRQPSTTRTHGWCASCCFESSRGSANGRRCCRASTPRRSGPRCVRSAPRPRLSKTCARSMRISRASLRQGRSGRPGCGTCARPSSPLSYVIPGSPGITHDGFSRHRRCHRATGGARHRW